MMDDEAPRRGDDGPSAEGGTADFFLHDVRRLRNALVHSGVRVDYIEQHGGEHVYACAVTLPRHGGR